MLRRKRAVLPYWIAAEEATCTACEHRHARAVTIFCVTCDRGVCPLCAVFISSEVFCPDCGSERKSWQRERSGKA
jgi:hypothetical protein